MDDRSSHVPSPTRVEIAMSVLLRASQELAADPDLAADEQRLLDYLASDPATCEEAEVLGQLVRALIASEGHEEAASAALEDISERRARFRRRAEFLRTQLFACLDALGMRKLVLPEATITVRAGQQEAVVIDEEIIPDEFFKVHRTLDRVTLRRALTAGREIPGAVLGNAALGIALRLR